MDHKQIAQWRSCHPFPCSPAIPQWSPAYLQRAPHRFFHSSCQTQKCPSVNATAFPNTLELDSRPPCSGRKPEHKNQTDKRHKSLYIQSMDKKHSFFTNLSPLSLLQADACQNHVVFVVFFRHFYLFPD